jgi:hypothetical protein
MGTCSTYLSQEFYTSTIVPFDDRFGVVVRIEQVIVGSIPLQHMKMSVCTRRLGLHTRPLGSFAVDGINSDVR